jgi:CHAD domain-containing protein
MTLEPRRLKELLFGHLRRMKSCGGVLHKAPGRVEPLHQMRVATRRFRETLAFLKGTAGEGGARELIDKTKRLTRSLGTIRNLDVSIGILKTEFGRSHPRAVKFAVRFLLERRKKRVWLAAETLARQDWGVYKKKLDEIFRGADHHFTGRLSENRSRILEKARHGIERRLAGRGVLRKMDLHGLRIAVKKLRYRLETLEAAGDRPGGGRLELFKKYQERLGRCHDYEVLKGDLKSALRGMNPRERNARFSAIAMLYKAVDEGARGTERRLTQKLGKKGKKLYQW